MKTKFLFVALAMSFCAGAHADQRPQKRQPVQQQEFNENDDDRIDEDYTQTRRPPVREECYEQCGHRGGYAPEVMPYPVPVPVPVYPQGGACFSAIERDNFGRPVNVIRNRDNRGQLVWSAPVHPHPRANQIQVGSAKAHFANIGWCGFYLN